MMYDENVEGLTQKPRNREGGFTLIELMVILLVVGILASIAIPLYIRSRSKPSGADVTGGVRTHVDPFDVGYDQLAFPSPEPSVSPAPSPEAKATPDTAQRAFNRSTDAPPAQAASTPRPAPAAPVGPTPGVEPPHQGPPDTG